MLGADTVCAGALSDLQLLSENSDFQHLIMRLKHPTARLRVPAAAQGGQNISGKNNPVFPWKAGETFIFSYSMRPTGDLGCPDHAQPWTSPHKSRALWFQDRQVEELCVRDGERGDGGRRTQISTKPGQRALGCPRGCESHLQLCALPSYAQAALVLLR